MLQTAEEGGEEEREERGGMICIVIIRGEREGEESRGTREKERGESSEPERRLVYKVNIVVR